MIVIKDLNMPVDCSVCFGRVAIWCRFDESDRIVVPVLPDESFEGRPEWCPLVDVPDINVGKCSEIPNNSDCVSRRAVIEKLKREFNETDVPDRYPGVFDAIEEWLSERELPSAQPEIILCKDCIHRWHSGGRSVAGKWIRIYRCKRHGIEINLNDFCSYAERKKDG